MRLHRGAVASMCRPPSAQAAAQAAEQAAHAPRASRFRIVSKLPSLDRWTTLSLDPTVQAPPESATGAPEQAGNGDVPGARPARAHVRGLGRGGQGRRHQARGPGPRCARLHHLPQPGAHEARAVAPTCGAIGHACRRRGTWASTTEAGTAACWWSAWRASPRIASGHAPTTRSTSSSKTLVRWGAVLLKFWVDVSPNGQLARFRATAGRPGKAVEDADEDWRNRDKYPQYKSAVEDMFRLTSTPFAPWIVLESDDKRFARVKALENHQRHA